MIVISLLFFLLGVGLLAAGLVIESIQLELGAVAAAMLSGLALYAGVRQRRPAAESQSGSAEPWKAPLATPRRGEAAQEVWSPPPANEPRPSQPMTEAPAVAAEDHQELRRDDVTAGPAPPDEPAAHDRDLSLDDEPAPLDDEPAPLDDEPAEEEVSPANVARVAARNDDVLVVDGRPRYHRHACSSLIGRDAVPLPVNEAREEGFTPCARCRPDADLLGSLERPQRH